VIKVLEQPVTMSPDIKRKEVLFTTMGYNCARVMMAAEKLYAER
jgi:hypothetical protein